MNVSNSIVYICQNYLVRILRNQWLYSFEARIARNNLDYGGLNIVQSLHAFYKLFY